DLELRVRRALAEHVKECPFLPREIAVRLARDIEDSVALPLLEHSPVLADDDLVLGVRDGVLARSLAIARRKRISPAVADALLGAGEEAVAATLLSNGGAEISPAGLLRLAELACENPSLTHLLVERPALPLAVCEALIVSATDELRDRLVDKHHLPPPLADE